MIHVYFHVQDARYSFFQSCVRLYSIVCVAWYFPIVHKSELTLEWYFLNGILPTHMCMYVEGEGTQSYLLDIWYVCRERTYTILFIIYMHTQVYLERDWICGMTHSFICIFVMYAFICVPWWFMYACICMVWYIYGYRIHVCDRTLSYMWLNHSNSGPRYAHRVL